MSDSLREIWRQWDMWLLDQQSYRRPSEYLYDLLATGRSGAVRLLPPWEFRRYGRKVTR